MIENIKKIDNPLLRTTAYESMGFAISTIISCCAFKLYIWTGRDAHPTRIKQFLFIQFKCILI